jgi:hypothetical protein
VIGVDALLVMVDAPHSIDTHVARNKPAHLHSARQGSMDGLTGHSVVAIPDERPTKPFRASNGKAKR